LRIGEAYPWNETEYKQIPKNRAEALLAGKPRQLLPGCLSGYLSAWDQTGGYTGGIANAGGKAGRGITTDQDAFLSFLSHTSPYLIRRHKHRSSDHAGS
jgi:hypothetical protein